jgi:ABC-type phosphate transport system substrate-binding protein
MFAILLGLTSCAYASDVFVIANPFAVPGKSLSYSMIEDIFTLRNKKWENGTAIKVYILPRSNPRTKEFTIKYLNMSVNRYFDLLEGRESLGKGNLVDVANTEYEIMLKVLTTPGSIGYASDVVVINFSGNIVIVK